MNLSDTPFAFSTQIFGRALFSPGVAHPEYAVVALHGYGQSPEILLPLVRRMVGARPAIAAVAAPFPMYDRLAPDGQTVYHWGTRHHWEEAIRIHHELVLQALTQMEQRTGLGAGRTVLLGFSQPVGLNYRFAATHPAAVRGVIGVCGGVPGRWEAEPYQPVTAALLHISRSEDEVYPAATAEGFAARLRHHAADVEFHMMPGGHRFPSGAGSLVGSWLRRIGLAG